VDTGRGRSLVADCCPSGFAKTFFRLTRRFVLADIRQLYKSRLGCVIDVHLRY
jgi:hypothetical protein